MPRKKILYVITKSNWGGAQRYVFDLATHLPKGTFEPVVACGGGGMLVERLRAENIRVVEVPSLERDISFIKEIRAFFSLRKLFRDEKPDAVHLNSSKAAALGALAARLAGVPKILFTVHGWPFGEERNVLSKILIWKISWLTALLSHRIIVVSDYDLKVAQRMPFIGHKTVLMYNGIGPVQFGSGEKIRSAFPARVRVTGTIGELNKNKNQQALIEEAKNNPDMYVAIVGDGEMRAVLEAKIKQYGLENRVKLFGFVPASEVLKGFDTFALPSIKEGLPYVLVEARAAGLPIVANRIGGVGEIVDAKDMSEFSLERMVERTTALYLPAQAG